MSVLQYLILGTFSIVWVYLIFRVASAAVIKSLERRKEKKDGEKE